MDTFLIFRKAGEKLQIGHAFEAVLYAKAIEHVGVTATMLAALVFTVAVMFISRRNAKRRAAIDQPNRVG